MSWVSKFLLLFFCLSSPIFCSSIQQIIYEFLEQYQRPVTILYISHDPVLLPVEASDVIVFWSDHPKLKNKLQRENKCSHILLTAEVSSNNLVNLAECEHFDIAVIEVEVNFRLIQQKAHLADYTFLTTMRNYPFLERVGENDGKNIYLISHPKTVLLKNWWKSCGDHRNYSIVSTFQEKYFIKPKEYTKDNSPKKYNWLPGINLYTFANLIGTYPTKTYIRERLLEIFNPLTHKDFGAANILIQGTNLKAIDYDDTIYTEDPYARLHKTLTRQLQMKYK